MAKLSQLTVLDKGKPQKSDERDQKLFIRLALLTLQLSDASFHCGTWAAHGGQFPALPTRRSAELGNLFIPWPGAPLQHSERAGFAALTSLPLFTLR